jgi:uncharacterized membrane protein YfcA
MDQLWMYAVCFSVAVLTLITGFGLGTVLTPVFALVFEVKIAIFLVAIVHFLNNLFKFALFRKRTDLTIVKRFGVLSLIGAIIGASLQISLYSDVVKVIMGVVLVLLGFAEIVPRAEKLRIPQKYDQVGGFLSGLLGGFVGNQGAIRAAYLLNYQISKETFIATSTLISLVIDLTRIPVYIAAHAQILPSLGWHFLLVVAVTSCGTLVGKRLLRLVSLMMFRKVIAMFVAAMGVGYALRLL